MKVDLVIATYNRADQLRETLQNVLQHDDGLHSIYVINNNSTDHTKDVLDQFNGGKITAIHNDENLGAAAGKNVGLRMSSADIIIVIDDDAIFCSTNPVETVNKHFKNNPRLGVIQFKIINYSTKNVLKYEFPGDSPEEHSNDSFEIGYFIGAGHALRKSMLEDVGFYPDDFGLYAHEEVDLSYRAVNNGYIMRYEPSVAVYHKKNPQGRLPPRDVLRNMFYNRLVMTRKYLPLPYSVINNFLWFIKSSIDSRSLYFPLKVYLKFLKNCSGIEQEKLIPEAIEYMRINNGRLYR